MIRLIIGAVIGLIVGGIAGVIMGAFVVASTVERDSREPWAYKVDREALGQ